MAIFNAVRYFLYILLWCLACVLLGVTAWRMWYTTHLPDGDPLNGGKDFYDPVVAELIATTALTILWVPYIIHVIHRRYQHSRLHSFTHSLLGLLILGTLYVVGAAIATHYWSDLDWCHEYFQCRLLTVLFAVAWAAAGVNVLLFIIEFFFVLSRRAWDRPMHGYEEPRKNWWW